MAENTIAKLTEELEAEKKKNAALAKAAEESNKVIAELKAKVGEEKEKAVNMDQYKVEVTCYWNNQLYLQDDTVDIPKGITPPQEYFTKLE
ncbi:MAG: hypothetical protein J6S85_12615 [Methanobrevibacter sp.]|nr:hypothetical protein [Methanobrevibacter sp.]